MNKEVLIMVKLDEDDYKNLRNVIDECVDNAISEESKAFWKRIKLAFDRI